MKKGSELECFLSYEKIDLALFDQIFSFLKKNNLTFNEERALLAYGRDYVTPQFIVSLEGLQRLQKERYSFEKFRSITLITEGHFDDVGADFFINFEFDISVITFSIFEGVLWNFDSEKFPLKIDRLKAFAEVCKEFVKLFPPKYSAVTNFGIHSEDISFENISKENKSKFLFKNDFLSEKEIQSLFTWFKTEYLLKP